MSNSFATSWTVAHQYMGFPRQEYWSGLPFPSPGDLLNPRIALQVGFLPPGKQLDGGIQWQERAWEEFP